MSTSIVQPEGWPPPKGYSNGLLLTGSRTLCISGQIGWDERGNLVSGGFAAQFRQALANVRAVVEAAGGEVGQIGRLTIFVTDKQMYMAELKQVGAGYREVFARHYPAMSLIEVKGLLEPGALVEIEATAILP